MLQTKDHKAYTPQTFDDLGDLDGISRDQIAEHLALYAGYVTQVNALNDELNVLRSKGRASGRDLEFAELTRRLGFEYNGMILHEYYFSNLRSGAASDPAPTSKIAQALLECFGSVGEWRTDFHAVGEMRGIGWVMLCEDPMTHRLANYWVTLHQNGVPASFKPLLVMDVWEHAFLRDYKATDKRRYIDSFLRNINWAIVNRRLNEPMAIRPAAAA